MGLRFLRFVAGLALLPVCAGATHAAVLLVRTAHAGSHAHAAAVALSAGFVFWLFLFFTLPRPMRTYIFAHELTHALWGWLMGARVSGIHVSAERGSVTLSRSNVAITLAPYFFPFYTVLAIATYGLLSLFFNVELYTLFWLGLVAFTWGFHFTFTVSTLMLRQSDILAYGRLFSYTVIYLLNVLGLCLWIVAVSAATLEQMVELLAARIHCFYGGLIGALAKLAAHVGQ